MGEYLTYENLVERVTPHVAALRNFIVGKIPRRFSAVLEVDDVIQMTWSAVLLGCEQFEFRGEDALRGWLFRIAENKLNDELTKLTAAKRGGDDILLRPGDSPGSFGESLMADIFRAERPVSWAARCAEICNLVELLIKTMVDEEQQCFEMRYKSGMTYGEIAQRLSMTENRVRSLIQRTLDELRRRLGTASDLLRSM